MIQATSKGEHYMARIEQPESTDEALLAEVVQMGVPVSVMELSRMSKMSTNKVKEIANRLRRHGLIEVTPDSTAGKAVVVASRVLGNIARSARSVDGAKLHRIVVGDTNALLGTPRKKPNQEEKEVLEGRRH